MPTRPQQGSCQRYPRGPGKTLAEGTRKTAARPCRPIAARAQRPTHQLSRYPRGSTWLLSQLVKDLRGGMQIFVKTLPPHQLSSLPAYMALHASLAWTSVGERYSGDGWDGRRYRPR